jgi:hypothetical protein
VNLIGALVVASVVALVVIPLVVVAIGIVATVTLVSGSYAKSKNGRAKTRGMTVARMRAGRKRIVHGSWIAVGVLALLWFGAGALVLVQLQEYQP